MKVEAVGSKQFVLFLVLLMSLSSMAQNYISEGKIVFERRTNLEKRFKGQEKNRWMRNADLSKPKIDMFELLITDSISIFKPIESDEPDDRAWFTMKNTTVQNFSKGNRQQEFNLMGTAVNLEDVLKNRTWRMTESKREIAGYNCRQALWVANDSVRIYAWYAEELLTSTGPETFNGLPGTILGLAIEDGGVVYFAKEVKSQKVNISEHIPKVKKKDLYSEAELRSLIENRFGSYGSMVDGFVMDMFMW